jgi:hypothetical protein
MIIRSDVIGMTQAHGESTNELPFEAICSGLSKTYLVVRLGATKPPIMTDCMKMDCIMPWQFSNSVSEYMLKMRRQAFIYDTMIKVTSTPLTWVVMHGLGEGATIRWSHEWVGQRYQHDWRYKLPWRRVNVPPEIGDGTANDETQIAASDHRTIWRTRHR